MTRRFSEAQIEAVNTVSILDYLSHEGVALIRKHNRVITDEIKGLDITADGRKWHDFYTHQGGGIVPFVMWYKNIDWVKAMAELLAFLKVPESVPQRSPPANKKRETTGNNKPFILPEKAAHYRNLFAYLTKTRHIHQTVIQYFVHTHQIYQDVHNNCVFLSTDKEGKIVGASRRSSQDHKIFKGMVAGSDCRFGFSKEGANTILRLFEAPIDLLSYLSVGVIKEKDYLKKTEDHFLAMNGLKPFCVEQYLKDHPAIDTVVYCVDRDHPDARGVCRGQQFIQDMTNQLLRTMPERFYSIKQFRNGLPPYGKDWNETLQHLVKQREQQNIQKKEGMMIIKNSKQNRQTAQYR